MLLCVTGCNDGSIFDRDQHVIDEARCIVLTSNIEFNRQIVFFVVTCVEGSAPLHVLCDVWGELRAPRNTTMNAVSYTHLTLPTKA